MSFVDRIDSVVRTIHPNDALAPVYTAQYGIDEYFRSALRQVDALEALSYVHMGKSLGELTAMADFACHYGRLLRALRVAAPNAELFACDIDTEALAFCKKEFRAQAFYSAWTPSSPVNPPEVDLLVCISLLTHTRKDFFLDMLKLWERMVRPGGLLLFTFLGEDFVESWKKGEMAHYGPATPEQIEEVAASFEKEQHAFHGYRTPYSETEYGIGFLSTDTIKRSIAQTDSFVLLELRRGTGNEFGQDVAVAVRRAT